MLYSPAAPGLRVLAEDLTFPESPRWFEDALWFVDLFEGAVFRLEPGGQAEVVCHVPGRPSGIGFEPSGRLLVVSMRDRSVLRLDRDGLVLHCDLSGLVPAAPNDMLVDARGWAYVGNLGGDPESGPVASTSLVLIDGHGIATRVGEPLAYPNGMAITSDGSTLVVAESLAARLSAFRIHDDGTLGARRTWAELGPKPPIQSLSAAVTAGSVMPDGIALDARDDAWVANANGAAILVAQGGRVLRTIPVPGRFVYAVALGDQGSTLYLCVAPSARDLQQGARGQGAVLACEIARGR